MTLECLINAVECINLGVNSGVYSICCTNKQICHPVAFFVVLVSGLVCGSYHFAAKKKKKKKKKKTPNQFPGRLFFVKRKKIANSKLKK